jgi:Domain of Unknown Function (DUF1259)
MSKKRARLAAVLLVVVLSGTAWWAFPGFGGPAGKLDKDLIGSAAGTKATTAPDGVVRIAWPRTDVKVSVDGLAFRPAAGLGSWAAFTPAKHGAMVMGDTVVSRTR